MSLDGRERLIQDCGSVLGSGSAFEKMSNLNWFLKLKEKLSFFILFYYNTHIIICNHIYKNHIHQYKNKYRGNSKDPDPQTRLCTHVAGAGQRSKSLSLSLCPKDSNHPKEIQGICIRNQGEVDQGSDSRQESSEKKLDPVLSLQ